MNIKLIKISIALLLIITAISCKNDDDLIQPNQRTFGIFKVLEDDTTIEMNGTINSKTPKDFDQLISRFPTVKTINMIQCPGSEDDESNLKVSKKMHEQKMEFHLFANSMIASGAVDMYVSGIKRTREAGSKIGVHSWSDGNGKEATDFPVGHANHLPYINYYKSVGFSQKEAEDFYYFTINAAKAEDIHYMTDEEIEKYKILKQ